jgi:hypothetical protein
MWGLHPSCTLSGCLNPMTSSQLQQGDPSFWTTFIRFVSLFLLCFTQTIQKHNKKNLTRRKNAHTQTNKQKRATLKLMCVFVAHTTFLFDDKYINTQAFPEFGYIRNYYVTWFERYVGAMKLVCDKIITCIRVCLDLDLDFLFQTLTYVSINFLHIYVCRRKHIDLLCCGRSIWWAQQEDWEDSLTLYLLHYYGSHQTPPYV